MSTQVTSSMSTSEKLTQITKRPSPEIARAILIWMDVMSLGTTLVSQSYNIAKTQLTLPSSLTQLVLSIAGAQMAAAVLGLGDSLEIATQSPVIGGTKDEAYILMLSAVGGSPPYSWDLAPGSAMFAGLELSSEGFISGERK
jgi:hypothetical protein